MENAGVRAAGNGVWEGIVIDGIRALLSKRMEKFKAPASAANGRELERRIQGSGPLKRVDRSRTQSA